MIIEDKYYVYMLRCTDNSLYTGITTDWKRRIAEHYEQGKKSAKYTKSHKVMQIAALWAVDGKSSALKLEKNIKSLSKYDKEKIVNSGVIACNDIKTRYIENAFLEDCIKQ